MIEARLIVPALGANQKPIPHYSIKRELIERFGGYTQTLGEGGWKSPSGKVITESVCVYDIALHPTRKHALLHFAASIALIHGQECVYVRFGRNSVRFVKPAGTVGL